MTHYVDIVIRDENNVVLASERRLPYGTAIAYLQHWEVCHPLSDCRCSLENEDFEGTPV
jgi:hypothetical protein